MKYLEILAADRKPVSQLAVSDVLTNPKYAQKAWAIWKATKTYGDISQAMKYFGNKNTFMEAFKRQSIYTVKGESSIAGAKSSIVNYDELLKSEIKIKHPLFADMINQIADFILGTKWSIDFGENKEIQTFADELIKKHDLHHLMKLQLKEKLIKSYSGTNFRITDDGKVGIEPIPAEAFGFFYDKTTSQEPEFVIVSLTLENKFLQMNEITKKEQWKNQKIEKYLVISKHGIVEHSKNPETNSWLSMDLSFVKKVSRLIPVESEQGTTLQQENMSEDIITTPLIPFSFMTTETLESELVKVKELIDALDINDSDAMSELIGLIKTLWVIKGSEGTSAAEAMDLIKSGVINLSEDGDAKKLESSSATGDRINMSDKLLEKFYRFSKTVDLEKLKSLSNTSGVAIKALFEPLNQKSKDIESELERYIIDFFKKAYMVEHIVDSTTKESLDELFKEASVSFNHSMITNTQEELTANSLQMGKIPEDIRLRKHPWLIGKTDEEIEAIIKEQKESIPEIM